MPVLRSYVALLAVPSFVALASLQAQESQRVAGGDPPLSEWVEQVMATGATPGMIVAVVRGDSVLLARGFGSADLATGQPVTDSTRFYIASTTKAFTALTFAILDTRGALRLDTPLARLLPDVRLHDSLSARAITLRDLLAMRNGIDDGPVTFRTAFTGEFTSRELIALLRHHPPARGGRAFRYSNIGFNIAGLALERRVGRRWSDVVRETVLEPLGMRSTTAQLSSVPAFRVAMPHDFVNGELARVPLLKSDRTMHAAGGHVTTAGDLARFLVAQLNEGRVRGTRGVPAVAIAEMRKQTVSQDRTTYFVRRTGWGLGLDITSYDGMTLYQRNGGFSGYYSHFSFIPERGVGVAVVGNGGLDGGASEAVAQGIYDLLLGRRDLAALSVMRDTLAAQVARLKVSSRERAATANVPLPLPPPRYFGRFVNEQLGTLTMEGNANTLVVRVGDSWGIARGVRGPDGASLGDALAANVLGGAQRFTVRWDAGADTPTEVVVRDFVFRRVGAR